MTRERGNLGIKIYLVHRKRLHDPAGRPAVHLWQGCGPLKDWSVGRLELYPDVHPTPGAGVAHVLRSDPEASSTESAPLAAPPALWRWIMAVRDRESFGPIQHIMGMKKFILINDSPSDSS